MVGHRQAFRAGVIHRDISENNVMLGDDMMAFFVGFLLDFDYGFNWREVLQKAGWEVSEESWKRYVEEYDRSLPQRKRPASSEQEIPLMAPTHEDQSAGEHMDQMREEWRSRMKMKERTVCTVLSLIRNLGLTISQFRAPSILWPPKS